MQYHFPMVQSFIAIISIGLSRFSNSFVTIASRAYLKGDRYSIHPIQAAKSFLFLKKPLNRTKGSIKRGETAVIVLKLLKALPEVRPSAAPVKPKMIKTRVKMKKCETSV